MTGVWQYDAMLAHIQHVETPKGVVGRAQFDPRHRQSKFLDRLLFPLVRWSSSLWFICQQTQIVPHKFAELLRRVLWQYGAMVLAHPWTLQELWNSPVRLWLLPSFPFWLFSFSVLVVVHISTSPSPASGFKEHRDKDEQRCSAVVKHIHISFVVSEGGEAQFDSEYRHFIFWFDDFPCSRSGRGYIYREVQTLC